MSEPAPSVVVCAALLAGLAAGEGDPLTGERLQVVLALAQAMFAHDHAGVLFADEVMATPDGPVIPAVRDLYGSDPVIRLHAVVTSVAPVDGVRLHALAVAYTLAGGRRPVADLRGLFATSRTWREYVERRVPSNVLAVLWGEWRRRLEWTPDDPVAVMCPAMQRFTREQLAWAAPLVADAIAQAKRIRLSLREEGM